LRDDIASFGAIVSVEKVYGPIGPIVGVEEEYALWELE
jgi:hypothetical protein